jgi:hypothetical protein
MVGRTSKGWLGVLLTPVERPRGFLDMFKCRYVCLGSLDEGLLE